MSPPGTQEKDPPLTFNAQVAIGKLKPAAIAEQIKVLVQQALEYQPEESEKIFKSLPIDETNLTEVLESFNPAKLVNEFQYINPSLPLKDLMKQDPLKVLEGVARILTVSDQYESLK